MRGLASGLLLACLAMLGALLFWPVHPHRIMAVSSRCLSNSKQAALGQIMYLYDNDERYPDRDVWMDVSLPYVVAPDTFRCPALTKGAYGFAYNGALSNLSEKRVKDPAKTALLYDSVNPIRNASDLVASLPAKSRHGKSGTTNSVAYADGHAKGIPAGSLP